MHSETPFPFGPAKLTVFTMKMHQNSPVQTDLDWKRATLCSQHILIPRTSKKQKKIFIQDFIFKIYSGSFGGYTESNWKNKTTIIDLKFDAGHKLHSSGWKSHVWPTYPPWPCVFFILLLLRDKPCYCICPHSYKATISQIYDWSVATRRVGWYHPSCVTM